MMRRAASRGGVFWILGGLGCIAVFSCSRGGRPEPAHVPARIPQPIAGRAHLAELRRPLPFGQRDHVSPWERAWNALEADRLDEAYRLADDLAWATPPLPCARSFLGLVELRAGRLGPAQRHFDAALDLAADECSMATARAGSVLALLESGDREAAYDQLEVLGEGEPRHVLVSAFRDQLRAELANEWLRRGREATASPASAAEALEHALRFAPEAADLHLEIARAYRAAGRPELALVAAKRSLALRPRDVPSLELYAELLDEEDRLDEALEAYETAAEIAPLDLAIAQHRRRLERRFRLQVPEGQLAKIRERGSLTRAELAAVLCGTLHEAMAAAPRRPVIVTDVRESWARELVLDSLALGLQVAYPGHAFEPSSRVSRAEFHDALRRAARWIDSNCARQAGGLCRNLGSKMTATEFVEGLVAASPRVTGKLALDAASALSDMAGTCRR